MVKQKSMFLVQFPVTSQVSLIYYSLLILLLTKRLLLILYKSRKYF